MWALVIWYAKFGRTWLATCIISLLLGIRGPKYTEPTTDIEDCARDLFNAQNLSFTSIKFALNYSNDFVKGIV